MLKCTFTGLKIVKVALKYFSTRKTIYLRTQVLLFLFLSLPIFLLGQNTFAVSAGVSESQVPVYSQKRNVELLDAAASNKLAFSIAYLQRANKNLIWNYSLSYNNLGASTLNRLFDIQEIFVNSVSLEYITVGIMPQGEIKLGPYSLLGGIGLNSSVLINSKIENYIFQENSLDFLDREDFKFKRLDVGIAFNGTIKREIGIGYILFLSLNYYQGFVDVSAERQNQNKVFLSNSVLSIGMEFPIKKEKG